MTVLQNILFPTRFQKLPDAETRAKEMADLVQVGALLDRRPSELSGGQQQRVALARALIKAPNLLLLDEPLSNLDATLRLTMRAEIRRITRELGVTTILVTHDQLEATTMADRIVCMNAGRIEQAGSAQDLYRRPRTQFVAGFIGSPPINLVPVGPAFDVKGGDAAMVGIRPEFLAPSETGLPVTISHVEPMGRETLVTVTAETGTLRFLEAKAETGWKEDDRLHINFRPEDTILFRKDGSRLEDAHARLAG
jgi:inositol-phosphate transport system ATP-binding protein